MEADEEGPTTPKAPRQTQRKVSNTAKRTPSGPLRKPSNNNINNSTTPIRKPSARERTPNSAPVRKTISGKKAEPTLFQDFLLGRPSPQRRGTSGARRKSLDVVKREIRLGTEEVARVPAPGGVKDRVKQWQKASAGAVVGDAFPIPAAGEEKVKTKKEEGDEGDRILNAQKRPGRRKSREAEDVSGKGGRDAAKIAARVASDRERSKSAAAPKKRVISDNQWMKKAEGKSSPAPKGGAKIPKDFLEKTALNPPVERKIDDWIKRNASEGPEEAPRGTHMRKTSRQAAQHDSEWEDTPRRRKPLKREPVEGGIKVRSSPDKGVRIHPSPDLEEDGIRVKPSRDNSFNAGDDSIRLKPTKKEGRPNEEDPSEFKTSRERSEKHLRPPDTEASYTMGNHPEDCDNSSWATPTRTESKRKPRKSGSPSASVSEIPFGSSAFSVLELPVGAEANTLRRPIPPKRNPSFAVPKVLKKVYSEGMKIVHDTVDPPRVGVNLPPSIESWLNSTTDPFVDRPATTASNLSTAEPPSRMPSYKEDNMVERDLMEEADRNRNRRRKRAQSSHDLSEVSSKSDHKSSPATKARETLPSMESSPPPSPLGLRRSPATRVTSSPKSARKIPLKEALLDAFRGESTTYRPKGNPLEASSSYGDNQNPPESRLEDHDKPIPSEDVTPKASPPVPRHTNLELPTREKPLPAFSRRLPPTTGEHRLSTIASVETFSTISSASETASEVSRTTVTQSNVSKSTAFTAPTASTLSQNSNRSGLKRRLTKHSDLVSMLSLPDTTAPKKAKSIKSARSVRTNRSHLETATTRDLMRELADDETKYMRELKTLVDGVVPVLLTSVLSKSDSAIAAGLFDDLSEALDASFTKPIVDMGISLERLKSLHNRIPLEDPKAFVAWLQGAHKSYNDYLIAWRMGFQDIVVNLAPASRNSSVNQSPAADEMPRNANGDVIGSNGARVDVEFLLKRPLVRIKYLEKILKGIMIHEPSEQAKTAHASWEELHKRVGKRVNEEKARLEDRTANNTDTTRARDPETLAPAEDVSIDRNRQVYLKDDFSLDMSHSTGQRIECEVEIIIRDKPSDGNDPGDVLIVASDVDEIKKWLLFPPIEQQYVSSRMGDHPGEVVIMIRDKTGKWYECFLLRSDDHEAANELFEIFGSSPLPPKIIQDDASVVSKLTESVLGVETSTLIVRDNLEVPIGSRSRSGIDKERARRQAEEEVARKKAQPRASTRGAPSTLTEESVISSKVAKNLNEAMRRAGSPGFTATMHARARYQSRTESSPPSTPRSRIEDSVEHQLAPPSDHDCVSDNPHWKGNSKHEYSMGGGLGDSISAPQAGRSSASTSPKHSTPLTESMRPEPNVLKKQRSPSNPQAEEPPSPPAHRVQTTPKTLKKATPVLDSPTPQAKNRRTSSPLKHEYQPSIASETSSSSEASDSEDESYWDSFDDDDELEAAEISEPVSSFQFANGSSPPVSLYNLPSGSVAPSNSASQAPYRGVPTMPSICNAPRLVAFISAWDDKHGRWQDLHNGPCSILVSPGKIEAFEMSAAHSSPQRDLSLPLQEGEEELRPLIEQGLTPHVNLRRGVAVDLNITSRPTTNSLLQVQGTNIIRYRTNTVPDNIQLYNLVHKARLENPIFKQLELDRTLSGYGQKNPYDGVTKRRSFFSRKNSYRASVRAPSTSPSASDDQSLTSSTVSRLRRISGSMFNIGKSTMHSAAPASQYGSSSHSSSFSGITPPRTPTSPSLTGTSTSAGGGGSNRYATENLKIRLYYLATRSSWDDRGAARITITAPPPGMRQRSTINQGITRRVIVTQDLKTKTLNPLSSSNAKDKPEQQIIIDEVLGADCFGRIGRSGVLCQIWDEARGDNGEVGTVGKEGGVSGRTRKWCFQTKGEGDADWLFGLCCVRVPNFGGMVGSLGVPGSGASTPGMEGPPMFR